MSETKLVPLPEDAVTPRELVAARPGISAGHLANLRSRGVGPAFYRKGRRVFYSVSEFDAWRSSRRVGLVERIHPKAP